MGLALIWALEQGLGPLWTKEMKEAWMAAYGLLSTAMSRSAA